MCTNFALINRDGTVRLAERLGVDPAALIYSQDFRPGATISIVHETGGSRLVSPAIWWLYLRQTPNGLKPHREYFSVNTNHARLPRKAEYRRSRCLIPVSAFVESQGGKAPHLLEPQDGSAMAFGGLYKEWTDRCTGERVTRIPPRLSPCRELLRASGTEGYPPQVNTAMVATGQV